MKRAGQLAAATFIAFASFAHAEISNQLAEAARPLNEGVLLSVSVVEFENVTVPT